MCGGRISELPENIEFEGFVARDDGGFMFHMLLPNMDKSELRNMLTAGEHKVAKLLIPLWAKSPIAIGGPSRQPL